MEIYALFDYALHERSHLSIEAFFALPKVQKATLLQYRDKTNSYRIKREILKELRTHWKRTIIINDDAMLALEADGLHVGQEDIKRYGETPHEAIAELKSQIGDRLLGLSTHNKEEVLIANDLDLDYIGLGAFRGTNTKDVSNMLGDTLDEIASYSTHAVAAIGGVKAEDIFTHVRYNVLGSNLYEN